MALRSGTVFAGFRIERTIGSGGMGVVYLARHPRLPRSVALKVLDSSVGDDPEFRTRFEREAELAVQLDHPNIVEIYDRGREDDELWISMRYVAGSDVSHLLAAGGPLPPHRAAAILTQAAAGLDAAHRRGLLHRDVKPANLLVGADSEGGDQVFVTDFGIARSRDDSSGLTAAGALLATLGYAAPEQIRGETLDHRADVYALGATLYQMLTGALPFVRATPAAVLHAHLAEPPPRPSRAVPSLPPAVDEVVARAMAKYPDQRYGTCGELAAAAARALVPPPPAPVPVPPQPIPAVPPRRRGTVPTALAVLVVVVLAVGIALVRPKTLSGNGIPIAGSQVTGPAATTAPATTTTTAPTPTVTAWGRDNDLVALFPRLLPATPSDTGYQGARCADLNVLNNGGAPALECTQDNGIHWYVWSFRRGDPRRDDTYRTNIDNDSTSDTTWTRPSGSGKVRTSYYPGGNSGLLTVGFDDPARAWVVLDVNWDHHTGRELFDRWWAEAPL